MSRRIKLTNCQQYCLVDNADFDWLNQWGWYLTSPNAHNTKDYAYRTVYLGGGRKYTVQKNIKMHRLIMNFPKRVLVDHINGDSLDNRRSNLRICTNSQNIANSKLRKDNTSGYKGVVWNKLKSKWVSRIQVNGKVKYLGLFDDKEEAHQAYCLGAKKYFGEFARNL